MTVRLYKPKAKDSLNWRKKDYKFACCDCNLVHRVRFAVKGSTLSFEVWRDNRATAALRRCRAALAETAQEVPCAALTAGGKKV